ncbi:hypothetical protein AAGS61_04210 [Lysinibacillus sp. KU-BSD001]|uniref:hypothetical protein n=1 Tax=Lysinibacillus sp. KU-BSD001 TaxID=3141328 RepID=UPI0036E1D446
MKIERAIYGLAADFGAVHWNKKGENVEYFHVEPSTVKYAKNVAFTLEHEPKQTVTTTKNQENGQLIIVQKGPLLFFKFIPTTKAGERIYRYVKLQKLRKCSYIFRRFTSLRDIKTESKLSLVMDPGEAILINHGAVYEICLTNHPRDTTTFCTTDANHPLLKGIEWKTNVQFTASDYWGQHLEREDFKNELDNMQRRIDDLGEKCEQLLKERGIKA